MLRFATIGTSMITDNLIEVLNDNPSAEFVGTFSRNAERAEAFTHEHGGTQAFSSLEALAASHDVDAVYIGSPNAFHHDQALACIAGGKHVLVEKPFGANAREAEEVFAAAEAAGVVAMEAMRPLHDPSFHICEDNIADLGRIRRAHLHFGKYSSRYDEILAGKQTNIFDCNMASGGLMDIGIYCVEPMVELFGAPTQIICAGGLLDRETQGLSHGPIDGAGVILAAYGDALVTLNYSKITNDLLPSQIEGESATMTIDKISTPEHARISYRGTAQRNAAKKGYSAIDTSERELELLACDNSMCYELADFICAVEGAPQAIADDEIWASMAGPRKPLGHYRDVTLLSLTIVDEARRQMGVVFPADAASSTGAASPTKHAE